MKTCGPRLVASLETAISLTLALCIRFRLPPVLIIDIKDRQIDGTPCSRRRKGRVLTEACSKLRYPAHRRNLLQNLTLCTDAMTWGFEIDCTSAKKALLEFYPIFGLREAPEADQHGRASPRELAVLANSPIAKWACTMLARRICNIKSGHVRLATCGSSP